MTSIYRSDEGHSAVTEWCEQQVAGFETPHDRRTVDTGLGPTHVMTVGMGTTPIVLVPPTNFSTATWLDVVALLARDHRVVCIDLPGQPGLSAPERHRHVNDLYGVWLAETLKNLDIVRCVLVGHSLGARVALAASVHVAGAERIVGLDPAGLARYHISMAMLLGSGRWFRKRDDESSRALLDLMMAPSNEVPQHLITWMTLVARHTKTTLVPPPLPPMRLKQIGIPIRILIGQHDVFLPPRRVRRAVRKMKTASVSWVEDAGHLMPLERPGVIADEVADEAPA